MTFTGAIGHGGCLLQQQLKLLLALFNHPYQLSVAAVIFVLRCLEIM